MAPLPSGPLSAFAAGSHDVRITRSDPNRNAKTKIEPTNAAHMFGEKGAAKHHSPPEFRVLKM